MKGSDRPVSVLHVTFNLGIGGTEQVIRQLIQALPKDQFRNEVVCIDGVIGDTGHSLMEQGITIHALARKPGFDRELVTSIRTLLRERQIDLVHCHQYTPYLYGWLAAIGTQARVVFTEHGRFHPDRRRYKAMGVNPLMALTSRAVVAISAATRNALATYEFMPRWRTQVIYNGIAPLHRDADAGQAVRQALGIPEAALVFGTVSRLDPVKNQRMMLEAFAHLFHQRPEAWLLMVGDGPDRAMLESSTDELGIRGRVVFTGFITQPAAHLNAMDVFLLSSHTEGTSMTLLEAMSLGLPSVVTGVGGNPEIVVNDATGLVTPPDDGLAFAAAMVRLADSPDLRARFGAAGKQRFETRFSVDTMAAAYAMVYRTATAGRGGR
ncbi:glycosyltransferase [Marinobacter sp. C2H3]|uniref:glycosyltransferase n=1 Tax=Marinobacter sp. C2H3 TaxID=3119003 RepID=UPI00300EC1DF